MDTNLREILSALTAWLCDPASGNWLPPGLRDWVCAHQAWLVPVAVILLMTVFALVPWWWRRRSSAAEVGPASRPRGDTNTATQIEVVTGDIPGAPTIHTGAGDIRQGTRYETRGDTYHIGGDVHIGVLPEQYAADLKEREREVRAEEREVRQALHQAHAEERVKLEQRLQDLETEKAEIARRLADTEASYQNYIAGLKQRIAELEAIRGQVPNALLDEAREALAQGDQSQADRLFAQIREQGTAVIQAVAEAAYQRSQIARDEIRYRQAYEHGRRAVRLAPENSRYLTGAGELAQILGDYQAARDYYEQALARDLATYGEAHPAVARDRNNLGGVWYTLGEYEQAIACFEQALAIFERKLGSEHPHTRAAALNAGGPRAGQPSHHDD
ncbi:MAG: tetratricopeptide repeat protein [Candidatus Thiosymbion ectosymbiont of Robbea hypermnestra]|nr:tetratricopeptide repeat protein [Candidatus Thiosymbion ectosymbiont of Robbea hypermnestra]